MSNRRFASISFVLVSGLLFFALSSVSRSATAAGANPAILDAQDSTGVVRTFNINGPLDTDNPFFQDLGTNGRRCVTCHRPEAGWTITPANVTSRFVKSGGTDPIFINNDGSNCEGALPQTLAEKRAAYSLLLPRGLIRVGLDVPDRAEFFIESVKDPNHCGFATNDVSAYRRPLPSTNLRFLSAVMWDGRESLPTTTIVEDLAKQANDETRAQADELQHL